VGVGEIFFCILAFLINIREMNPTKSFFPNLSLLSHSSLGGVTYVGVTSFALAWLKGLALARLLTGCHIGHNRDIFCRKTELRRLL
jgi:hypothetical protein